MNAFLFPGFLMLAFSMVIWILTYLMVFKKINKEGRCVSHTIGKVIGCSFLNYNGIHIPLVKYSVNGRNYKVAGPKFLYATYIAFSSPLAEPKAKFKTNLISKENLPKTLKIEKHFNSLSHVAFSPLMELYPVGSDADVFYNPNNPKDSYVQRFEGVFKPVAVILLLLSVLLPILSFLFLFLPEIFMHP